MDLRRQPFCYRLRDRVEGMQHAQLSAGWRAVAMESVGRLQRHVRTGHATPVTWLRRPIWRRQVVRGTHNAGTPLRQGPVSRYKRQAPPLLQCPQQRRHTSDTHRNAVLQVFDDLYWSSRGHIILCMYVVSFLVVRFSANLARYQYVDVGGVTSCTHCQTMSIGHLATLSSRYVALTSLTS